MDFQLDGWQEEMQDLERLLQGPRGEWEKSN